MAYKLVSGIIQQRCFHSSPAIFGASKVAMSKFDTNPLPYETLEKRIKIVADRLGKPLSLAEKVLYSHLDDPVNQDIKRRCILLKIKAGSCGNARCY
jgi:aconitate hydratase